MSLLDIAYEKFTKLVLTEQPDGIGGQETSWTDGETVDCAVTFDASAEGKTADKLGVSSRYTITTHRSDVLAYHDVLRRNSDGKIFRVTSNGDDKFTPSVAGLDMRQVTAEEWKLT